MSKSTIITLPTIDRRVKNNIVVRLTKWLILLVLILPLPIKVYGAQELTIEITQGIDNATAVAVVPFQWLGSEIIPEDVAQIVSADLERSGQFIPLPVGDMLSRPTSEKDVFFRDWRALGVEYLLIWQIRPGKQRKYEIEYQLFDVYGSKSIFHTDASMEHLRDGAHHVSDRVYEAITGIKGAFSTEILYITVERLAQGKQLFRLRKADADGHRSKTIFEDYEPILSPTWSPNGRHVAFVSFKSTRPAIYIQDTWTGEQKKLTGFRGINGAPDWSPDGKSLAMTLSKDGNPEIYTMEIATKKLTRLTNHYAIDTEPRWAPDGRTLVFTSNRGGSPQVYQLNVGDKSVRRLTFEGSYNARGDITPDGQYLVMVHRADGLFHIAVQHLEHGRFSIITETTLDESPSVAPNGSMLIYATQRGGQGVLGAVSIDGRVKIRLPSSRGAVREPAWSPFLIR